MLLALSVGLVVRNSHFAPTRITAYFTSATGIYPGDDVRVSGVKVGSIAAITPDGTTAQVIMHIDREVPIPADAKAVIVAQNLVAARFVQLTPAHTTSGPIMNDDAVIPIDRTAVPVEWDEVQTQLMRLATELGPQNGVSDTSVARFIDSAANAMDGNGDKLRETLAQLSGAGRILAEGSGDLVVILQNLQTFVTALRDSNVQLVQFQDRLATLSSVLNGSRDDLNAALTDIAGAVGDVQRFISGTRDKTAEQIQRLANVTQTVVDHRMDLENLLHVAPNAFSNGYNIYNPDTGTVSAAVSVQGLSNPVQFICGSIAGIENVTADESAKLCAQYLGPVLQTLDFNQLPFPNNPFLAKSASPENLIYTDPNLAPGGTGPAPGPPVELPSVSAYTGDNPPPAAPPSSIEELLLPGHSEPPLLPTAPLPAEAPVAVPPTPEGAQR